MLRNTEEQGTGSTPDERPLLKLSRYRKATTRSKLVENRGGKSNEIESYFETIMIGFRGGPDS